jgi:phosphatidylserine/phosphatidylglycerophosphate/cardiolipin synthase-like enzyme
MANDQNGFSFYAKERVGVKFLMQGQQDASVVSALLADFLDQATKSIHIAIFHLTLDQKLADPIITVLNKKATAGLDIAIAYDDGPKNWQADQLAAREQILEQLSPKIAKKGINPNGHIMHDKYAILDGGKQGGGSVWTGSTNWTPEAWGTQDNNIVMVKGELGVPFEQDFNDMWTSGQIKNTGLHDAGTIEDLPAFYAFSPGEGTDIEAQVVQTVSRAKKRIRIASMETSSVPILRALKTAMDSVHDFSGIYDKFETDSAYRSKPGDPRALASTGTQERTQLWGEISSKMVGKKSSLTTLMHNKIIVADDVVITGSYNFSNSAKLFNAENLINITDKDLADEYAGYVDTLVRKYGPK